MSKQAASWHRKRAEVLESGPPGCWNCGEENARINIHHRYYEAGKKKWEYDAATLEALCPKCHGEADEERRKLSRAMGYLGAAERMRCLGYMDAIRALQIWPDPSMIRVLTWEHAEGIADAFKIEVETVMRMAAHGGLAEVSSLARYSPLPYLSRQLTGSGQ